MGSVFNRGTKHAPNWYCKYKDSDGKWKMAPSHQRTKEQASRWLSVVEARIADGKVGIEQPKPRVLVGEHIEKWAKSLTNRDAKRDQGRIRNHVLPAFATKTLEEITLPCVIAWIDAQRAAGGQKDQTLRHSLGLLSRFFAWCIESGLAEVNPVRNVPKGRRPKMSPKSDVAFLDDDDTVRRIIRELPAPLGLMFYLANRSGLRTGEVAGLRMGDLAWVGEGVIRVAHSYDGFLKEDRYGEGKVKWVPAPDDQDQVLGPHLRLRRISGAEPGDLVFPCPRRDGRCFRLEYICGSWERVRAALGLGSLTWYQATRHSCASRNLSLDASLDEVSSALGHASTETTRRHYDHFVRRRYSDRLRTGLSGGANVVVLRPAADAVKRPA